MGKPIDDETIKRLKEWSNGGRAGPTNLEIFLTERCNLNCKFCGGGPSDVDEAIKNELGLNEWERVIEEAADLGIRSLFISGGEPVVKSETLVRIVEISKKYDIEGLFVTNGTNLSDDYIRRVVKSGWDNIMVSVDSARDNIHDYLRGKKGTLEEVRDTLRKIEQFKKEFDSEKPNIIITCVLNKLNYQSIHELVEFANKYNARTVRFQPMIKNSATNDSLALDEDEDIEKVSLIVEDMKTLIDNSNLDSNIHDFDSDSLFENSSDVDNILEEESGDNSIPCFQPWYGMKITPTGRIGPCESDFTWDSPINLKGRSLEDIWYGEYFNRIRERLKKQLPDECSKCCIGKVFEQREIREGLLENDF